MDKRQQMQDILKDTVDYYREDPQGRRAVDDSGDCLYTTENGNHCAIGRYMRSEFLDVEWKENNINIMLLIPTNTMSSNYWHQYIEGNAEYHPVKGRIHFLQDGKVSPFPSRNAYVCVIFRKS